MTMDDVIRWAREASIPLSNHEAGGSLAADIARGVVCRVTADQMLDFAKVVALEERMKCGKQRAPKPRKLQSSGSGAFLDEQTYCFEKGWREGAAAVREAIRNRGKE